jgi:hypothetical protein
MIARNLSEVPHSVLKGRPTLSEKADRCSWRIEGDRNLPVRLRFLKDMRLVSSYPAGAALPSRRQVA